MKKLLCVLVVSLVLFTHASQGSGVSVQVQASLDFVDLIKEVASWVKGAYSRADENESRRISQSALKLSGQLSRLAGEKSALASYLKTYQRNSSRAEFEQKYKEQVEDLNQQLEEIQATIDEIDPEWAGTNPEATFNATRAIAQKQLFLQERVQSYAVELEPGQSFRENLTELSNAYEAEAQNLLRVSKEISTSVKMHNDAINTTS